MPRTCTVCTHPQRDEIDRQLLDGIALRNIAKRYSLSTASLFRHNKHIAKTLSNARQEADILRADGLMEHLNHLTAEAERLKQKAEKRKDYRTALAGVREQSRLLEIGARLAVDIQERASCEFDFDGRPMERLSDVELLQILARGQGMTKTKFLRIAHGENLSQFD
jgi:exonuclease VII large subunit